MSPLLNQLASELGARTGTVKVGTYQASAIL